MYKQEHTQKHRTFSLFHVRIHSVGCLLAYLLAGTHFNFSRNHSCSVFAYTLTLILYLSRSHSFIPLLMLLLLLPLSTATEFKSFFSKSHPQLTISFVDVYFSSWFQSAHLYVRVCVNLCMFHSALFHFVIYNVWDSIYEARAHATTILNALSRSGKGISRMEHNNRKTPVPHRALSFLTSHSSTQLNEI